jgi:hypothetical protein
MFKFNANFKSLNIGFAKKDGFNQALLNRFIVYGFIGKAAVTTIDTTEELLNTFDATNFKVDADNKASALNVLGTAK